ncbi:hypothetical protein [Nocardioides marmoriginsengisoli]|uniref:hypothetical protein n=1 Tax=Nocardioides marmoriginsengisoli TaxID=661483 RepID=UPI0011CDD751|nr:hypothetical protein [Nocardioides marmoriginsengisoli]
MSTYRSRLVAVAAAMILIPTFAACSESTSSDDPARLDKGDQRAALGRAWDKISVDGRRGACLDFEADPIGTASNFSKNFDYDVVKDFLEDRC